MALNEAAATVPKNPIQQTTVEFSHDRFSTQTSIEIVRKNEKQKTENEGTEGTMAVPWLVGWDFFLVQGRRTHQSLTPVGPGVQAIA